MFFIRWAAALLVAFATTQAGAATLMTFTGTVIEETYGADPSPFKSKADTVALSVLFDDMVPPDDETPYGEVDVATYETAALSASIEIFDASQDLLHSVLMLDTEMLLAFHPGSGTSKLLLHARVPASPITPFVQLDTLFYGIDMFADTDIQQVSAGRVQLADNPSYGTLVTNAEITDFLGLRFVIDPLSVQIARDAVPISPLPAPPAMAALLTAFFGLRLATRRRVRS